MNGRLHGFDEMTAVHGGTIARARHNSATWGAIAELQYWAANCSLVGLFTESL